MNNICHIIGAGEICQKDIEQLKKAATGDYIIAADGGYLALIKAGINPNIIIGDFDSYDETAEPLPDSIPVIRLNPEKDYTDIHTSINHGLKQGFKTFCIYGAAGGRIDHTIANIQLLASLAANGYHARMFGTENIFDVIHNSRISFPADITGYISVFSITNASYGVYEAGLKYPLSNATLTNTYPLGVSNEFTGSESFISVSDGTLLIISPRK